MGYILIEVSEEARAEIEALLRGSFKKLNLECSRIKETVLVFEEKLSASDYHLLQSILVQELEW